LPELQQRLAETQAGLAMAFKALGLDAGKLQDVSGSAGVPCIPPSSPWPVLLPLPSPQPCAAGCIHGFSLWQGPGGPVL